MPFFSVEATNEFIITMVPMMIVCLIIIYNKVFLDDLEILKEVSVWVSYGLALSGVISEILEVYRLAKYWM